MKVLYITDENISLEVLYMVGLVMCTLCNSPLKAWRCGAKVVVVGGGRGDGLSRWEACAYCTPSVGGSDFSGS